MLSAIDFSEQSRLALRYAEAIALRGNAALTVAYVNDPLLVAAAAAALPKRQLANQTAGELRAFIDETLTAGSQRRLRVKSETPTGRAADEILRMATRHRSDLVVLGTHGLTGAERLLMGSTTLSILQRATIPVLAIPQANRRLETTVPPSWPGERIVAPVELDAESGGEADIAARIAQWFGSSLLLLHVVGDISAPAWMSRDLGAHERIRLAQAQRQIDALAEATRRRVKTEGRVICGRIADEIAAFAAAERTDLVITALRDRHAWFGARRGSVSYHVLSQAVTPVLAYPPRWRSR